MGLISIIMIFALIIFALFIVGLSLFKKSRVKALIMMSPLVLLTLLAIGAYNWFGHTTTPDSLELHVYAEDQKHILKGQWKERHDPYSYGIDLLVFFVPDNQKVELDNEISEEKQIPEGLVNDAIAVLRNSPNYPKELKPQIYQIELQDSFKVDFTVPNRTLDGIIIKYVHIVLEPMDSPTYWVKHFKY